MKAYINNRYMEEAAARLRRQIDALRRMGEEILSAEEAIKGMSYTDKVQVTLEEARRSLEENIEGLARMAQTLEEISVIYRQTEKRITDQYQLETVPYPKPRFGTSKFRNLDQYRFLMPF